MIALVSIIGCSFLHACAPRLIRQRPGDSQAGRLNQDSDLKVIDLLYQQVEAWKGVPYQFGGLSKDGIDCSGFVQVTFLKQFNIRLPRSTHQQSRMGDPVLRNDLSPGDLVFFRLGYSLRHVGIYIENGLFAHASKSKGVMLSRLTDDYWSKRYWKAARIPIGNSP